MPAVTAIQVHDRAVLSNPLQSLDARGFVSDSKHFIAVTESQYFAAIADYDPEIAFQFDHSTDY
jgi:hypothetical protein